MIIEVALNLIAEKGIDTFSIRDVAKRLDTYPT
ncbi:TetR family transcriptional regulator, partial [Vibrio sp. 10N.286.51.A4]